MSQRYVGRPIDYMDYEMELVNMLGFSIKKIPGRDRWGIYDESELVGTIDYRKLENRIRYKTEIYGKGLKFEEVRDEILIPRKYKLDKLYKINVRRPNGDLDKIVLHFDNFKSVYYDSCYNNCENSLIVSPQKLSISYWSHINMPSGKKRVIINEIEYCPRAGKLDYIGHYLSEDKEVIQQKIRAGIFCEEDEKIMDNYCASHPGTSPDKLLLIRNIEELEKDGKTLVNETNIVPLNVRDIANCGNIIGRELQWFIYRHRKCFPFKEDIFKKIFTQEALEYESLKPFKEAIIAALSTNKRVQSPAERYLLVGDSQSRNYDESSGPKMDAKKGK